MRWFLARNANGCHLAEAPSASAFTKGVVGAVTVRSSVAQAATGSGRTIQNLLHADVLDEGAEANYRFDWVVVLVLIRHKAFDCMGHVMRCQ